MRAAVVRSVVVERMPRFVSNDEITQPDISMRRSRKAARQEFKPLTRGQALYAVLWFGFDAREVRRYL